MKAEKLEIVLFRIGPLYILVHVRAGSFCPKLVGLTNEYLIHRRNQRSQKRQKGAFCTAGAKSLYISPVMITVKFQILPY